MSRLLTALVLWFICSTAAANSALVVRDDGYYLLTADSKELVKVDCVIDQRTSPGDPKPPTPEEPEEPDTTERAKQIGDLSKGVGTHEEATVLAAVTRTLADQGVEGKIAWDTTFHLVLNRVSGDVPTAWADWKTKVDGLTDKHSTQFFADVSTGISIAWGLDASALAAVADGQTDVDLGLGKKEITLVEIIALIKLILQLLNDLGILNP